jgi:hypothetical protein
MIGVSVALIAAVLLLFVILMWARATLAERERPSPLDGSLHQEDEVLERCPPEFVSKIFTRKDLEYVSELGSRRLEKFFRRERKAVALFWVQQTSAYIRGIKREHVEASRRSRDLEFATEARILLRYAGLQFICGVLFVSIELAGPHGLRGLALRADELAQRIHEAQLAFHAANEGEGIGGV